MTDQENLTRKQAAKYLGVSDATLRFWASHDHGPRFFKAGEKLVRYRRVDLEAWIEERLNTPASPKSTSAVRQRLSTSTPSDLRAATQEQGWEGL